MHKAIFYHAGCPVCVSAEQQVLDILDKQRVEVEMVHLGEKRNQIDAAEQAGVKSVPALLLDGHVFHINFGASLDNVKRRYLILKCRTDFCAGCGRFVAAGSSAQSQPGCNSSS